MRRSLKEEWECTATLPTAHTRDIYSATWSAESGLVASVGSDGIIAVYKEGTSSANGTPGPTTEDEAAAELEGDVLMHDRHSERKPEASSQWELLSTTPNAHGPYEINHATWCKRYDADCPPEKRGIEEMLVTTGDDGVVRPWKIS
ncbi:hypothetical protein NUW58_g10867 [Xylaria curta]|uniref:Uncharacterized protein n=1 Tax=Xylaria curta TaxID=42375 RepID=A0ACC1MES5_9PEZI|nr:hypothetical protein NUW58_g10867 [Xylaria curta]